MNGAKGKPTRPFAVSWAGHEVPRIVLAGEIDMIASERLEAALAWTASRPPSDVVVDVGGVTFFGSVGVNFLARLALRIRPFGHAVRVVSAGRVVTHPLEVCGLEPVLSFAAEG
jgi:anti-anti-sigma factor